MMTQFWYRLINKYIFISLFCTLLPSLAVYAHPTIEGIQIYQKNTAVSEETKQTIAHDLDRFNNADNMWDVLRSEFSLFHHENNPAVQEQIAWFMSHQDFLVHSAQRAAPYLYYILLQTRKRHLPAEMVLLPMIESAYNPFAYSSEGAAGIWQMMPDTASGYGIKQNWWYDGRRDVVASTQAALNYLVYLGGFFDGDWLLAMAAYDAGEGTLLSAIRRNIRNGQHTDFWSLPLPQETQKYVPRLLALATIIAHPEQYPVPFPPVSNAPYLAQIDVGQQIDLRETAYLAGLSYKQLKQLNPGHTHTAPDPHGPFKLILPIENVEQFTENLKHASMYKHLPTQIPLYAENKEPVPSFNPHKKTSPSSFSMILADSMLRNSTRQTYSLQPGDTLYMVRHGDNWKKIANRFHTSVEALLVANNVASSHTAVPTGDQVVIPTHFKQQTETPPQVYHLTAGDTLYMVRKGDTMEKIAEKFHTIPSAIRVANLLASNQIQEGDRLVIPTH